MVNEAVVHQSLGNIGDGLVGILGNGLMAYVKSLISVTEVYIPHAVIAELSSTTGP